MNYFELFQIPVSFDVDASGLKRQFYALSQESHPDRFSIDDKEAQAQALSQSAEINKAYKILKNGDLRLGYIIELLEKGGIEVSKELPQSFLMEMMDVNEAIMDYKMEPTDDQKKQIESQISVMALELKESFSQVTQDFDFKDSEPDHIEAISSYYHKSKYLKRIIENLADREVDI